MKRLMQLLVAIALVLIPGSSARAEQPDTRIERLVQQENFEALFEYVESLRARILADTAIGDGERALRLHALATALYDDDRIPLQQLRPALDLMVEAAQLVGSTATADTLATEKVLQDGATALRQRRDYEQALSLGERRIQLLDDCSCADETRRSLARVSQGKILFYDGQFEAALELVEPRLDALRAALGKTGLKELADVITLLAECHRSLGNLRENVALQLEAYDLLERQMAAPDLVDGARRSLLQQWLRQTNNLATTMIDLDRYRDAELLYREMASHCDSTDCDAKTRFLLRKGLASVARRQLRFEEAQELLEGLLREMPSMSGISGADYGLVYDELGWLQSMRGEFEPAERSFVTALDSLRTDERRWRTGAPLILRRLARARANLGKRQLAHQTYEQALETRQDLSGEPVPATGVIISEYAAWLLESDQSEPDPLSMLNEAIELLTRDALLIAYRADALASRARLHWREGRRNSAIEDMEDSLRDVELLRAVSGFDPADRARVQSTRLDDYHALLRWYLELGDQDAAWRMAERARARSLLDAFAGGRGVGDGSRQIPLLTAEEKAAERSVLEARNTLLDADATTRPQALGAYDRAYRNLLAVRARLERDDSNSVGPELSSLHEAQELLQPGEMLLSYFDSGPSASLMVVRANRAGLEFFELGAGSTASMDADLVERVRSSDQPFDAKVARSLSALTDRLLPSGLRSELEGASLLFVIPAGMLHRIPLDALVLTAGDDAKSCVFGLDALPPVHYLPSLSAWQQLRTRSRSGAPRSALVVAAPELPTHGELADLAELRFASREGRSVQQRMPDARVLTGREATESNFRALAQGAGLLHLATHGIVESRARQDVASLLFTPGARTAGRADDGLLDLDEIAQLRLQSDMTVLSACSSHFGRWVRGEGTFALTRSFLEAGSARVLGTMWPVGDYATAWLMERFYAAYLDDSRDTRTAAVLLHETKRMMRAQQGWEDPCHWAAFVMAGLR